MIIVERLREIQSRYGYLPDEELERLARLVGVPSYRIQEVASFFASFRQEWDKPAVVEVRVCRDMACHHAGAAKLLDPKVGLPLLTDDPEVCGHLQTSAPQWAGAVGHPKPAPERCKVAVEGVSCLGRCDRAPAIWIERNPMPAGEHAWVFARQEGESTGLYRKHIEEAIRAIARHGNPAPTFTTTDASPPDPDSEYDPHTNASYSQSTDRRPGEADHEHAVRSAAWKIDIYHGNERLYTSAEMVANYLKAHRGLAPWPKGDTLEKLYKAVVEAEKGKIDAAVAKAVEEAEKKAAEKGGTLSPERRADAAAGAERKEVEKVRREWNEKFIKENNEHLWKIKESGLPGMGGAGMPAYQKWLDVWMATPQDKSLPPAKYIVANGDESEPGTFKDRELLLRTPHLVIEGVILAGLMTGATAGYIFIRHEYFEQIHACREEIKRAEQIGACGDDVFGSGISFPVAVFESPGGYICGEQSALIEAMEDHRAQPRNRPPDLGTNGLWDMPTVVNNVETLSWAPFVVAKGGAAYSGAGWKASKEDLPADVKKVEFSGMRIFSISGDVKQPGVFEVPIGIPFGDLINGSKFCGGITHGRAVKAIATSGPSGGLLPAIIPINVEALEADLPRILGGIRKRPGPDGDRMEFLLRKRILAKKAIHLLDLPLDLNVFRNLNDLLRYRLGASRDAAYPEAMLGAGIVVYADGTDCFDTAVNFSQFFRNESCGKCVPCRIGSQKVTQLGTELLARRNLLATKADPTFAATVSELAKNVPEIAKAMKMTSICALGAVAPSPVWTALEYFPAEVAARPAPPPTPPSRAE